MTASARAKLDRPFEDIIRIAQPPDTSAYPPAPSEGECLALWDKYEMLENVRRHSQLVAEIAASLAKLAAKRGMGVDVEATRASGLLHDIAKTWCLKHGGSHAMIGASWAAMETRRFDVSQGVLLHVHWPWPLPQGREICQLPIFVLYADKRVRHDQCVSLRERFDDLLARYGKTEAARRSIRKSYEQSQEIEAALASQLGWNPDENPFDCGRLVD